MHIVYILRSIKDSKRTYIGYTTNLEKRLYQHNHKGSVYTKSYAPWQVETYVVFTDEVRAKHFERFLKSGSGAVFTKRRLISTGA